MCHAFPKGQSKQLLFHSGSTKGPLLTLRMRQTSQGTRWYADALGRPVPPLPGDPHKAKLSLTVEGETEILIVDRMEGGQRLVLPPEAADKIVQYLLDKHSLRLSAGSCHADVSPEGFEALYRT